MGTPVKADASFSVSRALQLQLPKQLAILEEVSEYASREYSLERALDKMQVRAVQLFEGTDSDMQHSSSFFVCLVALYLSSMACISPDGVMQVSTAVVPWNSQQNSALSFSCPSLCLCGLGCYLCCCPSQGVRWGEPPPPPPFRRPLTPNS